MAAIIGKISLREVGKLTMIDDVAPKVLLEARRKLPRMYRRDPHLLEFAEVPSSPDSFHSYTYVESVEYRLWEFVQVLIRQHVPHPTEASAACLGIIRREPELTSNEDVLRETFGDSFAGHLASYLAQQVWNKIGEDVEAYAKQLGFDLEYEVLQEDYRRQLDTSANP